MAINLHKHDSDRRDALYGGLLGASLSAMAVAAVDLSVFTAFAVMLLFLLTGLLLGVRIGAKPIRFGPAFRRGAVAGITLFALLVFVLRLLP